MNILLEGYGNGIGFFIIKVPHKYKASRSIIGTEHFVIIYSSMHQIKNRDYQDKIKNRYIIYT